MLFFIFLTTDLFILYLSFEGLTIPTFFLIFIYGSDLTKLRAAKFFLIYSFFSSTLLSLAIILLYIQFQTTSLNQLLIHYTHHLNSFTIERYNFIYLLLVIGFGIKIPLAPFHM
jgi:formate hydrogenlyase subunit 3/multisubunit Na+/H+ antiporter MnhD subunit